MGRSGGVGWAEKRRDFIIATWEVERGEEVWRADEMEEQRKHQNGNGQPAPSSAAALQDGG